MWALDSSINSSAGSPNHSILNFKDPFDYLVQWLSDIWCTPNKIRSLVVLVAESSWNRLIHSPSSIVQEGRDTAINGTVPTYFQPHFWPCPQPCQHVGSSVNPHSRAVICSGYPQRSSWGVLTALGTGIYTPRHLGRVWPDVAILNPNLLKSSNKWLGELAEPLSVGSKMWVKGYLEHMTRTRI